ncbi:four-carbon acid sugar kinase family protein [Paenibacillus sp. MER 99-2]|uniref:four-carbon acid sugar kinase family protein n=1 Tax=Paenibacillus sp. MER 99-2 TaxID=2939572 RepID=UPI00203AEDF3|nr:four-carbon acid sugar kinase family protein [Paenibacillus sp. MER 99-2]MCM3172321.1 hydroxyacid dehydrogenase [Paenibacillus sp. MER 99-2]
MKTNNRSVEEVFSRIPSPDTNLIHGMINQKLQHFNRKIIVLDDDPTGVQTVHGISVYTDWSVDSIDRGFQEDNSMFFILTNSRGFTATETTKAHQEIAANIVEAAKRNNREFTIISRGDSTLRGHYPLETEVIKDTVEANSNIRFDGEILLPFFKEGGRFTIDNVHYVQYDTELVPAGETEFAKDRTFGYTKSHLGEWAEEKSNGQYKADQMTYISLESLRAMHIDLIEQQLLKVENFNKVIVNAVDYSDVQVFTIALIRAFNKGKHFMFRSAAALTKVMGGVSNKSLLTRAEMMSDNTNHGGLVIIGSHVKKTTEQFEELKKSSVVEFVEFNVHLVLEPVQFDNELNRVVETTNQLILEGKNVAVYTKRERLDLGEDRKEDELKLSVKISDAVTSIVKRLEVRPAYIIAKGGITSSDIGTNGLEVKRATVAGQIRPGIPVWTTGDESKFPGISYVIFPGNVGTVTDLREVVEMLSTK